MLLKKVDTVVKRTRSQKTKHRTTRKPKHSAAADPCTDGLAVVYPTACAAPPPRPWTRLRSNQLHTTGGIPQPLQHFPVGPVPTPNPLSSC